MSNIMGLNLVKKINIYASSISSKIETKIILNIIACVILGLSVVPALYLCRYVHPGTYDDFLILSGVKEGIYFTFPLLSVLQNKLKIFPPLYHFSSPCPTEAEIVDMLLKYRAIAVFYIIFFVFSTFLAFYQYNKYFIKTKYFLFFYSIFIFYILNIIKNYGFFFYDYVLTSGYTGMLCFIMLVVALLPSWYYNQKITTGLLIALFSACANSGIQYFSVFIGCILFFFICLKFIKQKKIDWLSIFLLFFCIFCVIKILFRGDANVKQSAYSNGAESLFSFSRLITWNESVKNLVKICFMNAFDFKLFPFTLSISFYLGYKIYENKIKLSWKYFLLFLMLYYLLCFTLFYGGVIDVVGKTSSAVIFYFMVGTHIILFLAKCFSSCMVSLNILVKKYLSWHNGNSERNEEKLNFVNFYKPVFIKFFTDFKIVFFIISIFFIIYVGFIKYGLYTRAATKDIRNEWARQHSEATFDIYKTLIYSATDVVEVMELPLDIPIVFFNYLFSYDTYYYNTNFVSSPEGEFLLPLGQTLNLSVGRFFNKNIIIQKREEK